MRASRVHRRRKDDARRMHRRRTEGAPGRIKGRRGGTVHTEGALCIPL